MTKQEKADLRVKVAKDVLESLSTLRVGTGEFAVLHSAELTSTILKKKDSKKIAKELKKHCDVCALGACLLSTVALTNDFNFSKSIIDSDEEYMAVGGPELVKRLLKVFSKEQILLIENAFETGDGWLSNGWGNESFIGYKTSDEVDKIKDKVDSAIDFGNMYVNPKGRLEAIMQNIVKNKGTFIP